MKNLKKFGALLLTLVMMLSLSVTAFATEGDPTGSITIDNATVGETYSIYKVFDLTYAGAGETDNETTEYTGPVAYTFTKTDSNTALYDALVATDSVFVLTPSASDNNKYVVTVGKDAEGNEYTDEAIVAFVKTLVPNLTKAATDVTAISTEVKFDNLEYGYYYITSTLGTLVTIDSTLPNRTVEDKNEEPTLTKQVKENSTSVYGAANDADTGDTVDFKLTVTAYPGAVNYVITDSYGLGTFEVLTNSFKATVDEEEKTFSDIATVALTGDYAESDPALATGFTVTFKQTFLNTITDETNIVIDYQAILLGRDNGSLGAKNTAKMSYGATPSETAPVQTTTNTWNLNVFKYTGIEKDALNGAEFTLTDSDGKLVSFNKMFAGGSGYYQVNSDATDTLNEKVTTLISGEAGNNETGKIRIQGLDGGEYVLTETKAPDGYNLLKAPVYIRIMNGNVYLGTADENGNVTYGSNIQANQTVEVENQSGTELPSTGGVGTTIFYVLGGVLVLGAAILLITKRRMNAAK